MADQDDFFELDDARSKRAVYTIPGMTEATLHKDLTYKSIEDLDLKLDVYYPANYNKHTRLPAVILLHGDGSADFLKDCKERGQAVSWAQLIAASGLIAVTANYRSTEGLHNIVGVANDIDDLLSYVRDHSKALRIDADTLGIWTCSSCAPLGLRAALNEAPPYVHAIVCYYGFADLQTYFDALYMTTGETPGIAPAFDDEDFVAFSATDLLLRRSTDIAPIFIARAGLDYPALNAALDHFVGEALAQNVALTLMNHPTGQQGFDIHANDTRSHEIIQATLEFLKTHLLLSDYH